MGKVFNINPNDEFEFKGMVYVYGEDGKQHLHVNYMKDYETYQLNIEACSDSKEMRACEHVTYANFKRRYPKHRIYCSGYARVGKKECLESTETETNNA